MENLLLLFLVFFVFWSFLWSAPLWQTDRTSQPEPGPRFEGLGCKGLGFRFSGFFGRVSGLRA